MNRIMVDCYRTGWFSWISQSTLTNHKFSVQYSESLKIGTWLDLIWCIDPIYVGYYDVVTELQIDEVTKFSLDGKLLA